MTHYGTLLKTVASTLAIAVVLGACQNKTESPENSVSIQPTEVVKDTIALEDEVGFEKNPGVVYDDVPRHDFENFYRSSEGTDVTRNVAETAGGKWTVDSVSMDYNTFIGLYKTEPSVASGSTYKGSLRMWARPGETATFVIQVTSFCTSDNSERSKETITVTDQPQTYSLSHTFANAHGCALFRITNTTKDGTTVYAENASLNIVSSTP